MEPVVTVSEQIAASAALEFLEPAGMLWDGGNTIVLLAPKEPGFWAHFKTSPEFQDGKSDPLDRWSKRVIGSLSRQIGGIGVFPSDGPPYPPFISWARNSGRAWVSPVGMLVHDKAGLMLSLRGALRLPTRLPLFPLRSQSPCDNCPDRPCVNTCPVNALGDQGYDVATCKSHVSSLAGESCFNAGCLARRACPVSQNYGRLEEQSEFHMRAFVG